MSSVMCIRRIHQERCTLMLEHQRSDHAMHFFSLSRQRIFLGDEGNSLVIYLTDSMLIHFCFPANLFGAFLGNGKVWFHFSVETTCCRPCSLKTSADLACILKGGRVYCSPLYHKYVIFSGIKASGYCGIYLMGTVPL